MVISIYREAIGSGSVGRARRFSGSFTPVGPSSPKLTPRVNQLRREESSVDSMQGREAAHERELHSAILISQSWEDLTLVTDSKVLSELALLAYFSPFLYLNLFSSMYIVTGQSEK